MVENVSHNIIIQTLLLQKVVILIIQIEIQKTLKHLSIHLRELNCSSIIEKKRREMKIIFFFLIFTTIFGYYCMKSQDGKERGVISYKLYSVNNITNTIDVSLCGPLTNFENASVQYKGRETVELNDLSTEQIVSQSQNQMEIHYHLYNKIPDCDDYKLHLKFDCKNSAVSAPVIYSVDYDMNDVFFCTNVMFVSLFFFFFT